MANRCSPLFLLILLALLFSLYSCHAKTSDSLSISVKDEWRLKYDSLILYWGNVRDFDSLMTDYPDKLDPHYFFLRFIFDTYNPSKTQRELYKNAKKKLEGSPYFDLVLGLEKEFITFDGYEYLLHMSSQGDISAYFWKHAFISFFLSDRGNKMAASIYNKLMANTSISFFKIYFSYLEISYIFRFSAELTETDIDKIKELIAMDDYQKYSASGNLSLEFMGYLSENILTSKNIDYQRILPLHIIEKYRDSNNPLFSILLYNWLITVETFNDEEMLFFDINLFHDNKNKNYMWSIIQAAFLYRTTEKGNKWLDRYCRFISRNPAIWEEVEICNCYYSYVKKKKFTYKYTDKIMAYPRLFNF